MFRKYWWMSMSAVFCTRRNWIPLFFSCVFPCLLLFCQTAPQLPSIIWQQNVVGYLWKGLVSTITPPKSAADVVGQSDKTGSVTFRAAIKSALKHLLKNINISSGETPNGYLSSLKPINNNIFEILDIRCLLLIYWKIVTNQDFLFTEKKLLS